MTREQLEELRHKPAGIYGYKKAFCDGNDCCENCDKVVRRLCKVICWIEGIQTKRILNVCKPANAKRPGSEPRPCDQK